MVINSAMDVESIVVSLMNIGLLICSQPVIENDKKDLNLMSACEYVLHSANGGYIEHLGRNIAKCDLFVGVKFDPFDQ